MATFEENMKALEAVVDRLEKGDLPLEEAVQLFEEGMGLSESCKKVLDSAEGRIQVLLQRGRALEAEDLVLEEDE